MSISGTRGYIYIICNKNTGHHKIGRSNNPKTRLRLLQAHTSDTLEIVAFYSCDDMESTEDLLHNKYYHKKLGKELLKSYKEQGLSTEWFSLEESDIHDIDQIVENGLSRQVDVTMDIVKKPRVILCFTDDQYELIKVAAKRERRSIRNFATEALMDQVKKDQQ